MDVADLKTDLTQSLINQLESKGITELTPPQEKAIKAGLFDGNSMIVSAPTASGKTLIATMGIDTVLQRGKKAIYLVPLKALASEKYDGYTELFGDENRVAMSVGDKDTAGGGLASKDLIIMTVEKLDAVLRHSPHWIKDVDLVISDEIHLLNSENRGPTLEVTLTRLRELMQFQLLGLSATINNADELADWLDAELVSSDYRPVELHEGIYWNDQVTFYTNPGEVDPPGQQQDDVSDSPFTTGKEKLEQESYEDEIETDEVDIASKHSRSTLNLLDDTFSGENSAKSEDFARSSELHSSSSSQAIVFVNSRKSAEAEAERAGNVAEKTLTRKEKKRLKEIAYDIEHDLGSPTKQCRRLARCVRSGTAFHHAGLTSTQRSLVEEAFRERLLRSIAATPTLAAGMSLPAYRIIIRDVKRYTNSGLNFIPTLEYKQMAGRAGRPEHHDRGEAIAVAKGDGMQTEIRNRYILGEPENIYSKLAVEPVLRMHTLSLIVTRFVDDFEGVMSFFSKTFYAYQYGDVEKLRENLKGVVEDLDEYGFIDAGEKLAPTAVGRRVAELYVDPDSAHHMLEHLERAEAHQLDAFPVLVLLCETVEMRPLLRVKQDDATDLEGMLQKVEEDLLSNAPDPWTRGYDDFLESFKTALMLQAWIEEEDEDRMMEDFGVTPGGIRAKTANADWLLYACEELATLKGWDDKRDMLSKVRTRIQHGIDEELLRLVRFDQIGRVRARKLYEEGIETAQDIRDKGYTKLKKLIGKKTAKKLKEQVGQDDVFDRENIMDYMRD